jgi:Domain of unknown function (DUF4468) with TBP-like fold
MKKILLTSIIAILFLGCAGLQSATDMDKTTENVVDVQLSKVDIYNKTLQWMAQTFNSSKNVIQMQDSAQGVIIGNGNVSFPWGAIAADVHIGFKIEIKDNKYRFSSSNYRLITDNGEQSNMAKSIADNAREQVAALEKSLFNFLTQSNKTKDF